MKSSLSSRIFHALRARKRNTDHTNGVKEESQITILAEDLEKLRTERDAMEKELEKEIGIRTELETTNLDQDRLFRQEIEESQRAIAKLQEELGMLRKEKDAAEQLTFRTAEEAEKGRKALAESTKQRDDALNAKDRAEAEVREARKLLQDKVEQSMKDHAEIEAARAALEDAERDNEVIKAEQASIVKKLAEVHAAKEEAERDAKAQANSARQESKAAEAAQVAFQRALADIEQLHDEVGQLKAELKEMQVIKDKEDEQKRRLEATISQQAEEAKNYRQTIESANVMLAELDAQLENTQANATELKGRIDDSSLILKEAEARASRTGEEVLVLKKQIEDELLARQEAETKLRQVESRLQDTTMAEEKSRNAEEKAKSELALVVEQSAEAFQAFSREKEELEREWRSKVPAAAIPPTPEDYEIMKRTRKFKEGYLHFAVVGMAGCGKSSLINAFRGVMNDSPNAALTGIQTDLTTTTIGRYNDPRRDCRFIWYDFPGACSSGVSCTDYFNHQGLYVFDYIFVLWDNRLTDADISILESCVRLKIPYFLIRTKSDMHIQDIADMLAVKIEADSESSMGSRIKASRLNSVPVEALGKYITQTRQSVELSLRKANLPPSKVYMISYKSMVKIMQSGIHFPEGVQVIDERDLLSDILAQRRTKKSRGIPVRSNTVPWP